MAKTLINDYWNDLSLTPGALWGEIECIDRVINLRIKHANRAYETGMISSPGPVDAAQLVDDLLYRRRLLLDLIMCLRWEDTFTPTESAGFQALTRMISRKRCGRFVG